MCVFSYIHILKSELLYPINIFKNYFLLNMFYCVLNQVIAMGNTCIPVADSFLYLAKLIQLCKV